MRYPPPLADLPTNKKRHRHPRHYSSYSACHPQIHIAQGVITRASQDQIRMARSFSNGSAIANGRRQRDLQDNSSRPGIQRWIFSEFFMGFFMGFFPTPKNAAKTMTFNEGLNTKKKQVFSLLKSHNKQEVVVATAKCCSSKGQTTGSRRAGSFR